jgi:hypothetical protein
VKVINTNGTRGVSTLEFTGYEGDTLSGLSVKWNETNLLIDTRRRDRLADPATKGLIAGTGIPRDNDRSTLLPDETTVETVTATDLGLSAGSGLQNRPVDVQQDLGDTQLANIIPPDTGGMEGMAWWMLLIPLAGAGAGVLLWHHRRQLRLPLSAWHMSSR